MVCKTENIKIVELQASFNLDEGVVGYTYLKSKKYNCEFLEFSNQKNLPSSYKDLRGENKKLINSKIKGVLVAAAFQEGSITGLLGIDTDNDNDLQIMQEEDLQIEALEWIMNYSGIVKLLWRHKNNV